MPICSFRLAPDGVLIDHAAEFCYMSNQRIRTLFASDPVGYTDAVAKIVQSLATSETILSGKRPGATEATDTLKECLSKAGRLEFAEFFEDATRAERLKAARTWLSENWASICSELQDSESVAETALIGLLRREFHYFWLRWDPRWTGKWYSPDEEVLEPPEDVLNRLEHSISDLVDQHRLSVTASELRRWIKQMITTHYRIFGEYLNYFGQRGDEYLPAATRSSLRFIAKKTQRSAVETLVTPFVGLAALKKVKDRSNLVETVVEWSEGDGKEIVNGFKDLRTVIRTVQDGEERKRLLAEVSAVLNSACSRQFRIAVNLLRLVTEAAKISTDVNAAETAVKLSLSKSYRWLWQIRDPELYWQWKRRLEELLPGS